jgi:hypothetical protein
MNMMVMTTMNKMMTTTKVISKFFSKLNYGKAQNNKIITTSKATMVEI